MTINNKYKVIYQGESIHTISPDMVKKQKINDITLNEIKELHILFHVLVCKIDKEVEKEKLKKLLKDYHNIQFLLQQKWGFKEDISYHKFWELPKCSCPKTENYKNVGNNLKHYDPSCILHS